MKNSVLIQYRSFWRHGRKCRQLCKDVGDASMLYNSFSQTGTSLAWQQAEPALLEMQIDIQ